MAVGLCCAAALVGCGGGGAGHGSGSGKGAESAHDESGGTADGKNEVAAKLKAPAAGAKWLEQRSASLDFELVLTKDKDKAAGGMQSGSWSLEEERSYEVLASGGGKIEKFRIVFGKREAKPLLGVEQTTATAGHAYVLDGKGGAPNVTRVDGKEASPDERDALMSEYAWVGNGSPLMAWLKGGELADGASVSGGSAEARALLGALSGIDWENAKVSVTSHGRSGSSLALDVSASVRLTSGQTWFDLDLKGPAKVDLDKAWVSELTLAGNVKAGGHLQYKKGLLTVTGTGSAKLARKISQ